MADVSEDPKDNSVPISPRNLRSNSSQSKNENVRKSRKKNTDCTEQSIPKNETHSTTLNCQDPGNSSVLKTDETEGSEERPGMLQKRKRQAKEPKPGPSTQEESDGVELEHYSTDTDSDPTYRGADKKKSSDSAYCRSGPRKGAKGRKKPAKGRSAKTKKGKVPVPAPDPEKLPTPKKRGRKNTTKPAAPVIPKETRSRSKKETGTDQFLIAKADINLPTPFIWKVDRKSSMLQRFEISEQNGVLLYHSSFTYAAGNQFCVNNYVTADVKVLSPDTVQYLGPNLSETAEAALSEIGTHRRKRRQTQATEENFDYLKEDFTVYIQSLLSQDVDSSFLHEIKKFNDEYFLIPIQNLEAISEVKKERFLNEFWCEEFKKSIHTYPNFNILDSGIDNITCKACERFQGSKMLQFYGEAYDPLTLEHADPPPVAKTQFSVCDNCSISISLYSPLHHHKYNLFVQCHSKASEVKANNDNVQSHEDVLKLCLEDTAWIDKIFAEQVQIWRDCEKDS